MNNSPQSGRRPGAALALCCLTLVAWITVGCSGKSGRGVTLSGKVTYKKKSGEVVPVTGGMIELHPDKGATSQIQIKPDGTFSISNVPTGKFKVTVETESIKNVSKGYDLRNFKDRKPPQPESLPDAPVYVRIPHKYSKVQSTPLSWDIDQKTKEKDIELTD